MNEAKRTDLAWPLAMEAGALKQVDGLEMYQQRILRLLFTSPGELIHRPNWGVGLQKYRSKPPTVQTMQEIANAARTGLDAMPFVEKNRVRVYRGENGRITMDLVIVVQGQELTIEGVTLE